MTALRLTAALVLLTSVAHAATYKDASGTFSATAPSGWKQGTYPGTAVVFAAPPSNGFAPNINVIVQTVPAGTTQAAYHKLSVAQIGQLITDGKVLGNKTVSVGGLNGNQVAYTGRQGQYKLYFISTYAVKGTKAYVITATTLQGQETKLSPVNVAFVKGFKVLK
ncbi:DUF1795 domain-containing protein [Deinococcus sp. HMF7620]|uniref:DUF1795 domain-containing protein n=1 Tax=Deinococcus arboris TaxID=2682977 RepID=A0A7C9M868_9DEIO|nr:DcrB-related protein [Deinococcus arboris]MVN88385.1 DUF1795 domain-containing protein [Deinococcus arboris]